MLTDARFKFALESLRKYIMIEPKKSVFFSPDLIYNNLICVYLGASDNIENALRRILYIPDNLFKEDVELEYKSKSNQFCYMMDGLCEKCRVSSTFYINKTHEFSTKASKSFISGQNIQRLNFGNDLEKIRNVINNNINSMTKHRVGDLLSQNSIDSNIDLIMTNTIYLSGKLNFGYNIKFINNYRDNTVPDGNLESKIFNNGKCELLNAYITKLNFQNIKISILFLYPYLFESDKVNSAKNDEVIQLMERLLTDEGSQILRELLDNGIRQKSCTFPLFKIDRILRIYELLEMLGFPELTPFSSAEIDLPELSNVKLGDAVHKVNVMMTGNSITAAANNALFTKKSLQQVRTDSVSTDYPNYVPFPCVCLIYDREHRNILFCGVLFSNESCNVSEAAGTSA